jgi:hypothetical protein
MPWPEGNGSGKRERKKCQEPFLDTFIEVRPHVKKNSVVMEQVKGDRFIFVAISA